jgi:hypothetical protein
LDYVFDNVLIYFGVQFQHNCALDETNSIDIYIYIYKHGLKLRKKTKECSIMMQNKNVSMTLLKHISQKGFTFLL